MTEDECRKVCKVRIGYDASIRIAPMVVASGNPIEVREVRVGPDDDSIWICNGNVGEGQVMCMRPDGKDGFEQAWIPCKVLVKVDENT